MRVLCLCMCCVHVCAVSMCVLCPCMCCVYVCAVSMYVLCPCMCCVHVCAVSMRVLCPCMLCPCMCCVYVCAVSMYVLCLCMCCVHVCVGCHQVVQACALESDFKILIGGDMTEIGEKVTQRIVFFSFSLKIECWFACLCFSAFSTAASTGCSLPIPGSSALVARVGGRGVGGGV